MNVIWIVADTFRRDHVGAYGHPYIRTPYLDSLAERSVRFDRHYVAGFPTMPARADHQTGRWTMSFMEWGPLPGGVKTLGHILSDRGFHTAAVTDVPFYWRHGFNYDSGFQTFFPIQGQEGSPTRVRGEGHHEARDITAWWRLEADRNVARTMTRAGEWLERHYEEDFFLYVDTWDPHEPWDAPSYYTQMYLPDYDGRIVQPPYYRVRDVPGMSIEDVETGHASYCGEITMVDTWIGQLLRKVENMGLLDSTVIVFTSDHGFYFGEHDGMFGKMLFGTGPGGRLYQFGEPDAQWGFSPLYEEVAAIPLLISAPGIGSGNYSGLTSAVDVMPTMLELLGEEIPEWVEGRSLVSALTDRGTSGREFTVSSVPFANIGDSVQSVDNVRRQLATHALTTVTTDDWALIYSPEAGLSELYHLKSDPKQETNRISKDESVAREHHSLLRQFLTHTGVSDALARPRDQLRL